MLLGSVAVTALTAGLVGVAPTAAAADAQAQQWYLDSMKAEEIWKKTTGEGITVAVIDSGVNKDLASLKGKVLKGWDAAEAEGDETDDNDGHGTTMAEIIVGSGAGGGIKGLAPGAKVIPYRVSDTKMQNEQSVNAFDMEEAIQAAAESDAKIINISVTSDYYSSAVRKAVKSAHEKGKLVFAGAGNNALKGNKPQYPAAYPEAIAVAAIDRNGKVADYSQHGEYVDLAAPGSDFPGWCDKTFTKYCVADGTSNATAVASASAALIWSAHPDWTASQVLRVMFESAGRGDDWEPGTVSNYLGNGVVRPNAHITRGIGKPGDANLSPLTNQPTDGGTSGGTASAAPSAPSATASDGGAPASAAPSASTSAQAPDAKPSDGTAVAGSGESAEAESGGSTGIVIGVVAAVAVLAAAGVLVARRRRSA
ncbi:S8 family serine peptidase [Streptomyces omiyaensis]|uniref:S8 family serine peptidase n=1 Tax=Streptomyces omiyaensis TaxID=68247 RepID=A0ABW7C4I7_9ACTN